MSRTAWIVAALALTAAFVAAAPAAGADGDDAACTLSYPATCQATVGDVRVACSGVGAVPDCRAS